MTERPETIAPDAGPEAALETLAAELRLEGPVIAPHVADPATAPALGLLAAAGPRTGHAPAAYAAVVESVREGYLVHYGVSRLLAAADPDLRLLVGDHLYARGIERLVELGDMLAVSELSDLISLAARLHSAEPPRADAAELAWLAATVTVAVGPDPETERAKAALRASGDARALWKATLATARRAGLDRPLAGACEAVGFSPSDLD